MSEKGEWNEEVEVTTGPERQEAIEYLRKIASVELLREVVARRKAEMSEWVQLEHFGIGLWVRNKLREAGFGWDDQTLDGTWAALIEEAAEEWSIGNPQDQ